MKLPYRIEIGDDLHRKPGGSSRRVLGNMAGAYIVGLIGHWDIDVGLIARSSKVFSILERRVMGLDQSIEFGCRGTLKVRVSIRRHNRFRCVVWLSLSVDSVDSSRCINHRR